jgi:uncharacterized protein YgiM (DUF1202 family)
METMSSLEGFEVIFISLGGILCIYLGYRLFMIATNRPFKIFADLQGWKFKTANIAPGIFLAILGSVILCSPVITNAISILQKKTFINAYATKLILDELNRKNEEILSYKLENHVSLKESASKISPTTGHYSSTKLRKSNKAVVTPDLLRLRKEPGTHYQIIGFLRKGDVVTVKGTRGLWLRVSTGESSDGWIHGHYVRRLQGSGTADSTDTALLMSSNPKAYSATKR